MKKSDFSDVLQKAQAAWTAGEGLSALQHLSSFIDVQKPIHTSRSMPKVITEPFLPVMKKHNEFAIELRELTVSRQCLYHYRKLFSFSAPFTVDQAFRDYIRRIQNTLNMIGPDFDDSLLPQPKTANDKVVLLFSIQPSDLHNYSPQVSTVIFAFLALRMIVDTLRCTTMVGLYHDALEAFFLLCGQFNRKYEFAYVAERVLTGFMETTFKLDQAVGYDHFKHYSLAADDLGEVDSDLGVGNRKIEREYKKPNTLVASIHCKLCCIPLCHTFKLPALAIKLLESSASDITLLAGSIPRACASLRKLTSEYPVVEETPELIDTISEQSIMDVYREIDKRGMLIPSVSVSDSTTPSVSSVSRKKGPDNPYIYNGTLVSAADSIGTNSGASPATLDDLDTAIAAHLRAATSVFSTETYILAASLCRYKTVKLISSLDDQTKSTLLSEAFSALLSLRQDSSYTSMIMEYSNIFAGTRSTNPQFFINHPNIVRLTPSSLISTNAFYFDKQVRTICLESVPMYASRNLANGNVLASSSGTITSTSILDFVLQDIVGTYSKFLSQNLLDFLPLLYFDKTSLITMSAKSFIERAANLLLEISTNWSLGDSCVRLQEAVVKRSIVLYCIECGRDDLLTHLNKNSKPTLEILKSIITRIPLSDVMIVLNCLFAEKLQNTYLNSQTTVQQFLLDALGSRALIGKYDFVSKELLLSTHSSVSAFYLAKIDAHFFVTTLGRTPATENKFITSMRQNLVASAPKDFDSTKLNELTCAQLVVVSSALEVRTSDIITQRLEKVRQAKSSAQLRMDRLQAARELEQRRLQEYKEMVIQRQKRDEALDLETQARQKQIKRAAEVRQLQIKMAKQFIDDVAVKMHDTDLINYLTSFNLEEIPDPNDYVKIMHYKFEANRAREKIDRDIRTSNLAELTLAIARKDATERLQELDQLENKYTQPRLEKLHIDSQAYEAKKHKESLDELKIFNEIPGLDDFLEAYMDDCRKIYADAHEKWKAERDSVLKGIMDEFREKQDNKTKQNARLIAAAKEKMHTIKSVERTDAGNFSRHVQMQSQPSAAEIRKPEDAASAPMSYAERLAKRKGL